MTRHAATLASAFLISFAAVEAAPPPASARKTPPAATTSAAAIRNMTLREKIAQLIIAPCFGENPNRESADFRKFEHWVRDLKVGGLIVLNRVVYGNARNVDPVSMAAFLNQMQRLARTPLLVGGDFERGASMRVANTTKFPHNMAYGAARDVELTKKLGASVARESRAMGVHWVFAPVADVNNNPDNPVIGIRSFGERPADVASQVEAFIAGARSSPDPRQRVLLCVKHFPGHGDTNVDSHVGLGTVSGDRKRLDEVELVPFRAAIRAGIDGVMTGHLMVPGIDPEPVPATVSEPVLTGLLRRDLGFEGLIATDAMDMKGLTSLFPAGEAGVRALLAGADVLLMPSRPEEVIDAVAKAVKDGRITVKRIERSVAKILAAKSKLGLQQHRFVDLEAINKVLEAPDMEASAQKAAEQAVTVVRNRDGFLPLRADTAAASCLYVVTDNRRNLQGMRLIDEMRARAPQMKIQHLDPAMPEAAFAAPPSEACRSYVVAAFANGNGNGAVGKLMAALQADAAKPILLVSLNSPYLLRTFPSVAAYVATFSNVPASESGVAKVLFGEIPARGKLPVTIPELAQYGDGLQVQ
jgi:beta-N-acetylhexosaminidase